jgi:tRNA(fMet)-specific endonuclease VapC
LTVRYLLDTGIVSNPISKKPDSAILRRLEEHGAECAIAAPTWHELTFGCRRLPKGKRRSAIEAYLREVVRGAFPNLPYDEAAATWHGEEPARLESLGQTPPFVDGQIAAIAKVHGLTVVTTNDKDFGGFKGLAVENWSTASVRTRGKPT